MRCLRLVVWLISFCAVLGGFPAPAAAQKSARPPLPTPIPPPILPPELLSTEPVAYPEGAHGEAVVVLELTIGPSGAVDNAIVVSGQEPFAGAVLVRARGWRFAPARRGDADVAARTRMRIEFHPPPPPAESGPSQHGSAAEALARVVIEREQEVYVRGELPEPGKITVTRDEVRQMPGAFGDSFRMMEAFPGVAPVVSGLPFFYVRGAPPGNTGYYLDGVRLPLLYHVGLGPGVIHPGLIDHVDFFPGAPPASYGRFTGGILAGRTRPPATEWHGEWNVRLLDSGALVEAPFAEGRGSVLVAGRYGYPGLIASLASDARISYWDYQARMAYKLTDVDTISAFVFGSSDYLGMLREPHERHGSSFSVGSDGNNPTREKVEEQVFKSTFHRLDLRYDHRLGRTGNVRVALTLGADRAGTDLQGDTITNYVQVGDGRIRSVMLRTEMEGSIAENARLRAGADVAWDHTDLLDIHGNPLAAGRASSTFRYAPRNDVTLGAYADVTWRPSPKVEIVPGVRADVFTSRRVDQPVIRILDRAHPVGAPASAVVAIDPRLAARVGLAAKVTSMTTVGLTHQPPSTLVPMAGLSLSEHRDVLQTSIQASQGLEIALPFDFTATGTFFWHEYRNLSDAAASCGRIPYDQWEDPCVSRRVRGRAFGFELLVRRALTRKLTGWLSYTLARSTREALVIGTQNHAIVEVPQSTLAEFDRTHVLNLVGAYDLGRNWRAGLRFMLYSGRPTPRFDKDGGSIDAAQGERLPGYYRFDLRLEKGWRIGKTGRIAFVLEGLNITLNKEDIGIACFATPDGKSRTCQPDRVGPVAFPSIGLEGSF